MFTLFHFCFDLFKIAIQAAVYSAILLALLFVLAKVIGNKRHKLNLFVQTYFVVAGLLLVFSFTYYGEHGLGDEAEIPLGQWKQMKASDGYAYFDLNSSMQIRVDSFLVRNHRLYMASEGRYYDYQLVSGRWMQFVNKKTYEDYAVMHQLPSTIEFKPFWSQYDTYWNGWRFWFLP